MKKSQDNLVSIVVPVYNAEEYIEDTVNGVLSQTYPHWELLLVNDCSRDGSREKIEQILKGRAREERIRLIDKQVNEGAAMARNTGVDHAAGRYIAFLDADDIWKAAKLEEELRFMKEKNASFVFTAYEFGDEEGRGTGKVVRVPERLSYRQALSRTVIFTSTVLFDTEKINRSLIKMKNVKSEDTALWWSILRQGYTGWGYNQVTVIYRRPRVSLSSNKAEAVKRIWNLYRKEEGLSFCYSIYNFVFWALRATLRRL